MTLINPPPEPQNSDNLALWELGWPVQGLKEEFETEFEQRYFGQFDWFRKAITQSDSILNVGCSWGRETLALFWIFQPSLAVGIDSNMNGNDIETRQQKADRIKNLIDRIPTLVKEYLAHQQEQIDEVGHWYENSVPDFIKAGGRLEYYEADITDLDTIREPDNYFDLIYSRYVIDKILDSGGEQMVINALENMRSLIKPITGKLAIVTPSLSHNDIKGIQNIEELITRAGLVVINSANAESLGFLEVPETEPKGFLCMGA